MNIVYCTDEKYIRHAAAAVASLFESALPEEMVHVFILDCGVEPDSKERFLSMERENRKITFLTVRDPKAQLEALSGIGLKEERFPASACVRLLAPFYLPEEVDRFLYLDCDTLVLKSLSELWRTDLKGAPAAFCPEPTIYRETRAHLGLGDDEPYFNSGVILADRKRWDEEKITEKCMEWYARCNGCLRFPDQDILNLTLRGRGAVLPPKWNFLSNYHYESWNSLTRRAGWYESRVSREEFEEAKKEPCIVHFGGAQRPWIKGNFNPYREEYHLFLDRTPWKGTPDQPGQRLYMLFYHAVNLLTAAVPGFRRCVSELYFKLSQ